VVGLCEFGNKSLSSINIRAFLVHLLASHKGTCSVELGSSCIKFAA
jgi:hypothetical protein